MLEAHDIQKCYGGVVALSGAHLTVRPGSVHALLGENGAGKSTLIKVLTGATTPDQGVLKLKGEEVRFAHTDDAARHGVGVVSQELSVFPDLDVLANLFPTRKPRRRGLVNRQAMAREARPVLAQLGLGVGLDTPVGELTIGQQQLVEIARGVLRRPTVLVLDEPTSALDAEDTERLLTMLESLREQNVGVLIVSHILEEVRRLADEVTVLRDGHTVMSARPMAELDIPTLVEAMLGDRPDVDGAPPTASPVRQTETRGALVATSISVPGLLSEVSIKARPGEVVGLTGLAGSGHQTLLSVLSGRVSPTAGEVVLPDGSALPRGVLKAIRSGVALVTGDRRRVGLMLDQPVWENVGHVKDIASSRSWSPVRRTSLRTRAEGHVTNLGIRPADVDMPVGLLSGGNQQKVVLAKWLEIDPSVLLLDDPTRGVDVGAKAEIHRVVRDLTADGRVAVLCSTDLEELAELCDRVYVLYRGEVAAEISAPAINSHTLLTLMNGPAPAADDPPRSHHGRPPCPGVRMTELIDHETIEEVRDGMRVLWDVEVPTRDGTILKGDVFLPLDPAPAPVILSHGCYAKGISFQEGYAGQWTRSVTDFPEIEAGSSGQYQCWEVSDPEQWVKHGYSVVRVDSRGAGGSPGVQHLWGQQEVLDYYDAIEWAGTQTWSDGNVGLLGISYYAANQWRVAALQPPHLKAIVPWEGSSDQYRELYFHGGIRSTFLDSWAPRQLAMQHGYGERGLRNPLTGRPVAGDLTLSEKELEANRVDVVSEVRAHPLFDDFHAAQAVDWSRVTIPVLSSANWGGQGLHLRGNIEGFSTAAGPSWLEVHGLEHWTHFYTDYGLDLQRRFLDHFLKGVDNGWDAQPPVQLQIRHVDGFVSRAEREWPLARTQWQRQFLDVMEDSLRPVLGPGAATTYDPHGDGVFFLTPPFQEDTEITGPLSASLHVSSSSTDADLFLVLGLIDPNGDEVTFRGAMDAHTPVAQGWLRASHRALDAVRSRPERPFHVHDKVEPLVPEAIYQVDVEIWPTSVVVPAGHRLRLNVRGRDYEYAGPIESGGSFHRYPSRGCGPFLHPFGEDRQEDVYGAPVTIHTGAGYPSSLLLPVIPGE